MSLLVSLQPKIVVTLKDGSTITWHPGEETPYAVEAIESFLGPGEIKNI